MAAGLHWIVCPRTEVVVRRAARFCRPMGIPQFSRSKGAGAQGGVRASLLWRSWPRRGRRLTSPAMGDRDVPVALA